MISESGRRIRAVTFGLLIASAPAFGQQDARVGNTIEWWHAAAALGSSLTLIVVDEPVRDQVQAIRTGRTDAVATAFRQLGEFTNILPMALGAWAGGAIADDKALERAGARLTASFGLSVGLFMTLKIAFGRERPDGSGDATNFRPFSIVNRSFPSGHTAIAFSLATTLADDLDEPWFAAFMYAAAAGTGWSRMNDDRHWLSDVAFGAVVGIASSKLVSGRWLIGGIEAPSYLTEPRADRVGVPSLILASGLRLATYQVLRRIPKLFSSHTPHLMMVPSGAIGFGWSLPLVAKRAVGPR